MTHTSFPASQTTIVFVVFANASNQPLEGRSGTLVTLRNMQEQRMGKKLFPEHDTREKEWRGGWGGGRGWDNWGESG